MDLPPRTVLKLLLPRLPLILQTAIRNLLSLSQSSAKQSLQTELVVAVLRDLVNVRARMAVMQRISTRDPGVKEPLGVAKVTIPAPEGPEGDDLLGALRGAIHALGDGAESYDLPTVAAVEAEWHGFAPRPTAPAPAHGAAPARPDRSERDHYRSLMDHVSSPTTILYFHGGAYFLMDPATVRDHTGRLARRTGGRCYSVRYRLAPQHPFPAQLLDALIAYLALLAPPPASFHEPVSAHHVVFAGDSAGGNLALALLQLLLTLRRTGKRTLRFHGVDVPVHLPAGLALHSPWADVSRALPSIHHNAHFDYLAPPAANGQSRTEPLPDALWPTSPPRAEIFCDTSMLIHPLVSPVAAPAARWQGMPPIFLALGNEVLQDEIIVLARRMAHGGGVVSMAGYDGMPHCFAMIFPASPAGQDCYDRWAQFCSSVVDGRGPTATRVEWMTAFSRPPRFADKSLDALSALTDHEVDDLLMNMRRHAFDRERRARARAPDPKYKAKL